MQYGGQTPLKLSAVADGGRHSGSGHVSADAIDIAEDRERFQALLHEARPAAAGERHCPLHRGSGEPSRTRIGYPVVIRPSYVLGGRAMEIVHDRTQAAAATCARRCEVSG